MNLYLRLLILLIKSHWKARLDITDTSILAFRVLPNDLDINMHMNNGRFNSIMDLGRVDILLRTGLLNILLKKKWTGIVASIHTQFYRPLTVFQAYELHSQIVYWDEKWTWIEHKMYSHGKLIARALVQTVIRGKQGNIPNAELQNLLGINPESPAASADIKHFEKCRSAE